MVSIGSSNHERIYRYREYERVFTRIDPFEDALTWVRGLRSLDYTADLLDEVHSLPGSLIRRSSTSVASHAKRATEFVDQALSGPREISYLPLYYGILNLAKAMIVAGNRLLDLEKQRRHGASWSGIDRNVTDMKNDELLLWGQGTIPLLYQVLTGSMWPNTRRKNPAGHWVNTLDRRVKLSDVYPYIVPIGFEYAQAYGVSRPLAAIIVYFEQPSPDISRVVVQFPPGTKPTSRNRRSYKFLRDFREDGDYYFLEENTASLGANPKDQLCDRLRLFLLYDSKASITLHITLGAFKGIRYGDFTGTYTPVSGSNLLLPEELPILLAFFHLSNVVRYAPERLLKLHDSRASAVLQSLIRQGTYRFIELFWSYMNKKTYVLGT